MKKKDRDPEEEEAQEVEGTVVDPLVLHPLSCLLQHSRFAWTFHINLLISYCIYIRILT